MSKQISLKEAVSHVRSGMTVMVGVSGRGSPNSIVDVY